MKSIITGLLLLIAINIPAQFDGTPSTSITGNLILDFSFNKKDSLLLVLTSNGLSYTNPYSINASTSWYNFPSSSFPGIHLIAATASDSSIYVSGYNWEKEGVYGGKLFIKSKTATSFIEYDPSFKAGAADDEFYRTPAAMAIGDSFVFVSLNRSALLRNKKNSPNNNDWKVLLISSPATFQTEIQNNVILSAILTRYTDTLRLLGGNISSIRRLDSAFSKDIIFKTLHVHTDSMLPNQDTVIIKWQRFFYLNDTFRTAVDTLRSDTSKFDSLATHIADSIIPHSINALLRRNDTLQFLYSSDSTRVLRPADYPPADYNINMQINDIRWHNGILFSGWAGGLTISTDNGKTQKDGLFVQVPSKIIFNTKEPSDSFRVFVKTRADSIAVSAWLPNASLDSLTGFPKHIDSLKKWSYITDGGISDIAEFEDTLFVSYGKDSPNGIRKYYQIDTTTSSGLVREWRFVSIPLTGLLEPQLGTNTIVAIPIDSIRYDLWTGTDEGLYQLTYGTTLWRHIEYKKPLSASNDAYAFPTVIYPGFKSTRFAYSLKKSSNVTIEVFDFSMRKVKTVSRNVPRTAGERSDKSTEDRWDGRDDNGRAVSPGVYYFKVSSSDGDKFGKIIVYGAKDVGME
jgi:hypothetical protein